MKGQYNLRWVTEFLAYAYLEDFVYRKDVIVRKKKVKFTHKVINELYRTRSFKNDPNYKMAFPF